MSKAGYAVGAIIALGALSAGTSEASAGGKHFRHHKFHNFNHRPLILFSGGCGYYRDMWYETGRFYWKSKYYHCKGWW